MTTCLSDYCIVNLFHIIKIKNSSIDEIHVEESILVLAMLLTNINGSKILPVLLCFPLATFFSWPYSIFLLNLHYLYQPDNKNKYLHTKQTMCMISC